MESHATVIKYSPAFAFVAHEKAVSAIMIERRTDEEAWFCFGAETAADVAVHLFRYSHAERSEGMLFEIVAFAVETVVG